MLKTLKRSIALVAVSVLGASGLAVIAAPAANATAPTTTAITASAVARVGGNLNVRVTQTAPATFTTSDKVAYVALATPVGATVAPRSTTMTSTGVVNFVNTSGDTITAGSYTLLVWVTDTSGSDTVPNADAVTTRITFTAGGAPATLVPAATAVTGAVETPTGASIAISATLTDAAGVTTLANANETISLAAMSTGAVSADTSTAGTAGSNGAKEITTTYSGGLFTGGYKGLGVYSARVGNTAAGTTTATMAGTGLLTGTVPAVSFTISTFTALDLSQASDTRTISFPDAQVGLTLDSSVAFSSSNGAVNPYKDYDTTGATIWASTATAKTITFAISTTAAQAGSTVLSTIAAVTGSNLPAGVTAATSRVTLDSTGAGTVTVAATAPAAGERYTINIGKISFTIIYATPAPRLLEMGPNATLTTVVGGSTALTATATDQFGDGYAGALVTFKMTGVASRNGIANRVIGSGTTNADGVATATLTDASTAALTTSPNTDVIEATAQFIGGAAPVNSSSAGATKQTVTISYVASLAVETITVTPATSGANAKLDTTVNGTVLAPALELKDAQDWNISVASATGAPISGVPVVVTVTNGVLSAATQSTTRTVYTSSGTASITLIPTKTGKVTITATSGGKTGTSDTVTVVNAASYARVIALDAATYAVAGGELKRVKATVTDRFGNPVRGVDVSFSTTAGRFAGGALAVTGTTGADGVAVADLAPMSNDPAASGTLTASFGTSTTGGDTTTVTATTTREDGLAYPARVRSVTATVTTTAASSATASNPAIDAVKTDVKAVSDTVATLSKAVTTVQSSVTELTQTFTAQIKSLTSAIAKISRAIAAIQKSLKARR